MAEIATKISGQSSIDLFQNEQADTSIIRDTTLVASTQKNQSIQQQDTLSTDIPAPVPSGHLEHVTSESARLYLAQNTYPVVLNFGAEWCGFCKRLDPLLQQLAERYKDQIHFLRVDLDRSKDLALELHIPKAVPCTMFFSEGQEDRKLSVRGLASREQFEKSVDAILDTSKVVVPATKE